MHEDLKAMRRARLLFNHLAEGLTAYVALSGRLARDAIAQDTMGGAEPGT